ncbi:MAG TPA: hypothetical protein PLL85_00435, partial [Gemmiger qucibialis]|nr:hypothetical protein [Gemmiger qucibialis]
AQIRPCANAPGMALNNVAMFKRSSTPQKRYSLFNYIKKSRERKAFSAIFVLKLPASNQSRPFWLFSPRMPHNHLGW